jgi:hypothetical protein
VIALATEVGYESVEEAYGIEQWAQCPLTFTNRGQIAAHTPGIIEPMNCSHEGMMSLIAFSTDEDTETSGSGKHPAFRVECLDELFLANVPPSDFECAFIKIMWHDAFDRALNIN